MHIEYSAQCPLVIAPYRADSFTGESTMPFTPNGANHDIYINPRNGRKSAVPRHSEIKDSLVKLIFKQLDIK